MTANQAPEWTERDGRLTATYATGSMTAGLAFVTAVVDAAEAANHHPDIDLRYPTVGFTLVTHDADDTITDKDRSLAATISALAADRGIAAS